MCDVTTSMAEETIYCEFCSVTCSGLQALLTHFSEQKHRDLLAQVAPGELEQLERLHYFAARYMSSCPIVGLDDVKEERQADSSYLYTCMLCAHRDVLRGMVIHITSRRHRKQFRKAQDRVARQKPRIDTKGFEKKLRHMEFILFSRKNSFPCELCSVSTEDAGSMYTHIVGRKHMNKLRQSAPEQVEELGSLSYLLRTNFKEVPILGLEYVFEWKEDLVYTFFCELCTRRSNLRDMIVHITDADHMECYIRRHHPTFSPGVDKSSAKAVYLDTLRCAAVKILEKYGRKEIKLHSPALPPPIPDSEDTSKAKRKLSPQRQLGPEKILKKPKINDPPLQKKDFFLPEDDQMPSSSHISEDRDPCLLNMETAMVDHTTAKQDDLPSSTHISMDGHLYNKETIAILECSTAEQELDFQTNNQLLEYLAKFVIDDQEDATFVQKITQNCIKALIGFHEHEAESLTSSPRPQAPLAHTSRADPKLPNNSGNIKIESCSSSSKTALLKVAPNSSLGLPKTKANGLFSNKIQNANKTKVVGIFQNIPAADPETVGMQIPVRLTREYRKF